MKVKRYTEKYYRTLDKAQAEANRTGKAQNVIETIYGVFTGPCNQYPANGSGYYSTVIRPR